MVVVVESLVLRWARSLLSRVAILLVGCRVESLFSVLVLGLALGQWTLESIVLSRMPRVACRVARWVPLLRSVLRNPRQCRAWNSPWKTPSCLLAAVPSRWANRFRVTTVTR